jgi:hypothetical protein
MDSTLWRVTLHDDPRRKTPSFDFYFRFLIKHNLIQKRGERLLFILGHTSSISGEPFSLINYSNLIESPFMREMVNDDFTQISDDFNGRRVKAIGLTIIRDRRIKNTENEKIIKCNIRTLNIEPCPNFLIIDVI